MPKIEISFSGGVPKIEIFNLRGAENRNFQSEGVPKIEILNYGGCRNSKIPIMGVPNLEIFNYGGAIPGFSEHSRRFV